ncbi:hypothetical protein BH11CYA1_BH11CYA1_18450 [soil metagenome]
MEIELTDCDKEPVQFIDCIQPYGALIAIDQNNRIIAIAGSADFVLQKKDLGKDIKEVLKDDSAAIMKLLEDRIDSARPVLIRSKTWRRWMTALTHRQGDVRILELEVLPTKEVDIPSIEFLKESRESLYTYLGHITANLKRMVGYDRVMVYRFAPDWHGEVVAETISLGAHKFMGHHFPASDIPLPARQLFLKNWVRAIFDVDAVPIPLEHLSTAKLDLSRSALRSASPIHLEYLRNMDVSASLTLSLIHEGRLWGLIACHHFEPKYITSEERNICALIAKLVSTKITSFITGEAIVAIERVSAFTEDLTANISEEKFRDVIHAKKASLLSFVSADGFVASFHNGAELVSTGEVPSASETTAIIDYVESLDDEVVHLRKLIAVSGFEHITSCAGLMAIKLDSCVFIWLRKEFQQSIIWAGNPNKAVDKTDSSTKLSPRQSFNEYSEVVKDTSASWEAAEVSAAAMLKTEILRTLDGIRRAIPRSASLYQEVIDSLYLEVIEPPTQM